MSTTANPSSSNYTNPDRPRASVGTPYLVAYFAAVIGALLSSAVLGSPGLGVHGPWFFVGLLALGCALGRAGMTQTAAPAPAMASESSDAPVRTRVLVKDPES
jgi:C4-dicarboxylate transporter